MSTRTTESDFGRFEKNLIVTIKTAKGEHRAWKFAASGALSANAETNAGRTVDITRRTLFENSGLQIALFEARPASDACGDVERQGAHVMVLPVSGLFARHDAPGRFVTGTSSHAVLVAADTPYRVSFPGAIGDRGLTLRFGDDLVPDRIDRRHDGAEPASHGLLPPYAMMLRNLLLRNLASGQADALEAEACGLDLLDLSLSVMRGRAPRLRASDIRRRRAVERVKEAVTLAPADDWSVARLADVASLSPFHLCHVFRQTVGVSLFRYVLQERLAFALDAVLDGGDLTSIALDAGFASHSHFTARFRTFFGCTPVALRRLATPARIDELRKIMTAPRRHRA
jgi:AraC-like DNA-binding protein